MPDIAEGGQYAVSRERRCCSPFRARRRAGLGLQTMGGTVRCPRRGIRPAASPVVGARIAEPPITEMHALCSTLIGTLDAYLDRPLDPVRAQPGRPDCLRAGARPSTARDRSRHAVCASLARGARPPSAPSRSSTTCRIGNSSRHITRASEHASPEFSTMREPLAVVRPIAPRRLRTARYLRIHAGRGAQDTNSGARKDA